MSVQDIMRPRQEVDMKIDRDALAEALHRFLYADTGAVIRLTGSEWESLSPDERDYRGWVVDQLLADSEKISRQREQEIAQLKKHAQEWVRTKRRS